MCKSVVYLGGVDTVGIPRSPEICLKERFTCHANEGEETSDPEHLEGNEGGAGFSETSRAELQRPSPGVGDLLERAEKEGC